MRKEYYIWAPPYNPRSAGVKALHYLCHELNRRGETAYIIGKNYADVNSALNTPLAYVVPTKESILVYPEIIEGNPYGAQHVVRWLLYYAGAYSNKDTFASTEQTWGYTTRIARDFGTGNVMFLPTVDETFFVPPPEGTKRKGSCYYAHKYKTFFGGKPSEIRGSVEITNPGQTREEVLRLLQTSEVFYAYEDTALIIEAALCGCPAVCMPSTFFRECCGLEDFSAGVAWGMEELDKALSTVKDAHKQYALCKDVFKYQLAEFIERTQNA